MRYTLTRIDPPSAAKVVAMTAGILSAVLVLVGIVVSIAMQLVMREPEMPIFEPGLVFGLLLPFMYLVGGYFVTLIVCIVLNAVTQWLGGISFELEE